MKKLFFIIPSVFIIFLSGVNAQDILKVKEIEIVNTQINNVTIQIEAIELNQLNLNRINETNANEKVGFNAHINTDNTLLTLNFTQKFNESELYTLLEYCGLKLNITPFNQLYNLINQ